MNSLLEIYYMCFGVPSNSKARSNLESSYLHNVVVYPVPQSALKGPFLTLEVILSSSSADKGLCP